MRTVRSQLAIFEAEVGLLRENQASAEKEWKDETSQLESELNQVITQKVHENGIYSVSSIFRSVVTISFSLYLVFRLYFVLLFNLSIM